jgi:hypothetical protein
MSSLYPDFRADLRDALRGFKRTPGLTAITVLTLAVGLGASAAIFRFFTHLRGRAASSRPPLLTWCYQASSRQEGDRGPRPSYFPAGRLGRL